MNGFSFNVNTIGIPNVRTAPWNLQHIKDLKMTKWSVETCSPIISGNKCCADVNNWLIICLSTSWCLYANLFPSHLQVVTVVTGIREVQGILRIWYQNIVHIHVSRIFATPSTCQHLMLINFCLLKQYSKIRCLRFYVRLLIHYSVCFLSYNMPIISPTASFPHSTIYCFLVQFPASCFFS